MGRAPYWQSQFSLVSVACENPRCSTFSCGPRRRAAPARRLYRLAKDSKAAWWCLRPPYAIVASPRAEINPGGLAVKKNRGSSCVRSSHPEPATLSEKMSTKRVVLDLIPIDGISLLGLHVFRHQTLARLLFAGPPGASEFGAQRRQLLSCRLVAPVRGLVERSPAGS